MESEMINFYQPKEYEIDFSKVKTVEDIVEILKSLDVKVYDNYVNFDKFKPYLKEIK